MGSIEKERGGDSIRKSSIYLNIRTSPFNFKFQHFLGDAFSFSFSRRMVWI
jgi:hypothetical protein